jgi:hypothetical protein
VLADEGRGDDVNEATASIEASHRLSIDDTCGGV